MGEALSAEGVVMMEDARHLDRFLTKLRDDIAKAIASSFDEMWIYVDQCDVCGVFFDTRLDAECPDCHKDEA